MIKVEINRIHDDFGFEATDAYGHAVQIDTSPETGGTNFGARPMQLLMMALGGCSGIDIVSILKKQRQEVKSFKTTLEGERESGVEPSLWRVINVLFKLEGTIEPEKAKRACQLSMEKYCSVAETLRKAGCMLNWKVSVNGNMVD